MRPQKNFTDVWLIMLSNLSLHGAKLEQHKLYILPFFHLTYVFP